MATVYGDFLKLPNSTLMRKKRTYKEKINSFIDSNNRPDADDILKMAKKSFFSEETIRMLEVFKISPNFSRNNESLMYKAVKYGNKVLFEYLIKHKKLDLNNFKELELIIKQAVIGTRIDMLSKILIHKDVIDKVEEIRENLPESTTNNTRWGVAYQNWREKKRLGSFRKFLDL